MAEIVTIEPSAPPNGGPATQFGNSGVTEGPPSVSCPFDNEKPATTTTHIMNKPIDTRSMVTGIFLGVLVVLCLGATLRHGNQPGRFQLGVGDGQTAYVIDTVSGQVWEKQELNQKEFVAPKDFSSKSANDVTEREMKELGQRMVQVAKARYETGIIGSAEKILQAILEIDPGSQAARYYLGLVQEAVQANKDYIREWYPTNPPRPVHQ